MTNARTALTSFYKTENLPADGNQSSLIDWVTVFGIPMPMINTESRKRILPYHDLHHLVTGYGTDEAGEYELGAWTIATGKGPLLGRLYDGMAATLGLIRYPRRTVAAYRRGLQSRNLYDHALQDLLEMDVATLRTLANVDQATR